MIDRDQAEQLAAVWARRDSLRLGRECRPVVAEFDLGYVIISTPSTHVSAPPGDLPSTVVDKRTGEVSTWPRVPPDVVARLYRRSRIAVPPTQRTVDPAGQLLREIHRLPVPTTTARLTVEGRIFTAQGAKGDVVLNHHPLVRAYLDVLPAGRLVRGGERHAEVVVVSDVLHEYDRRRTAEGIATMSLGDARNLLSSARIEVSQVRDPGDRHGGPADRPCDSCLTMLVEFSVLPRAERAHTEPWFPEPAPDPVPGRFPRRWRRRLSPPAGDPRPATQRWRRRRFTAWVRLVAGRTRTLRSPPRSPRSPRSRACSACGVAPASRCGSHGSTSTRVSSPRPPTCSATSRR
ncbi:hypothetical protein GCM10029963_36550 [Micromonospora andamanensis]